MKNFRRKQPTLPRNEAPTQDNESFIKTEWQNNGSIAVVTATVLSRQSIDEWFDVLNNLIKNWPADKPYLLLHDSGDPRNILSPYVRARVREFYPFRPDLKGKIAVVVPRTISGQMIKLYMKSLSRSQNITMLAFFSREEGLDWLVKSLD